MIFQRRDKLMAKVSVNGNTTNSSRASGHVKMRRWISDEEGGGYYQYSTTSATINGTVRATSQSFVKIGGENIAVNGDNVSERDSYSIPSGWSGYDNHSTGTGKVTSGSSFVFINGTAVANTDSSVRTHANTTTTIKEGSDFVFIN